MRYVATYVWSPEDANYCVIAPSSCTGFRFVKYTLTNRGINLVYSNTPDWMTLKEAETLASERGGFEVAKKNDCYRSLKRALENPNTSPAEESDYW